MESSMNTSFNDIKREIEMFRLQINNLEINQSLNKLEVCAAKTVDIKSVGLEMKQLSHEVYKENPLNNKRDNSNSRSTKKLNSENKKVGNIQKVTNVKSKNMKLNKEENRRYGNQNKVLSDRKISSKYEIGRAHV